MLRSVSEHSSLSPYGAACIVNIFLLNDLNFTLPLWTVHSH